MRKCNYLNTQDNSSDDNNDEADQVARKLPILDKTPPPSLHSTRDRPLFVQGKVGQLLLQRA